MPPSTVTSARRRPPAPAGTSAAARVLDWIERHIADHGLGIGAALPTELELAAAAGASRSSVREALTALKVLGIIRSRRKGGIRIIRDPVLLRLRSYFAEQYASPEQFRDAMEFRAAMEWGLGPFMLDRISPATLAALRQVVAAAAAAPPEPGRLEAAETRFHTLLASAGGNPLASLFARLYVPIFGSEAAVQPATAPDRNDTAEWVAQHTPLLDALAARDAKAFFAHLKEHLQPYLKTTVPPVRKGTAHA